jgi:hypothetical protein
MRAKLIQAILLILISSVTLLVSCDGGGGGGGGAISPPSGEGSETSPLSLGTVSTSLTHSGWVGAYGTSFYTFTTGSTSGTYTITLTNTHSDLSWAFADPVFTAPIMLCDNFSSPGANDEICSYTLAAGTTYYLAIDEWDTVAGAYTLGITSPATATPTGVSATAGFGKITVSWSAATNATSYNVYWSTTPGGALSGGTKISGITATSCDHIVPAVGIPYYYVVTAENQYGESAKSSSEVNATPLAKQVPPLTYNFDDGTLQGWTTNGTWNVSTDYLLNGPYSVRDSPLGNYQNNSNTWLASPVIDLTATTMPTITFRYAVSLETNKDLGYVELSTDGGSTWVMISPGAYTGTLGQIFTTTIYLTPYTSSNQVVIRFRMVTNSSVTYDGWAIDDIVIKDN